MISKKNLSILGVLLAASLVLAACAAPAADDSADDSAGGDDGGDDAAAGEDLTVTVFGAFVDVDAERFEATVLPFEEETGIDIVYEGSGDFESLITVRVEGGDPPDLAAFPQPGLLADFVSQGEIVDVTSFLERSYLEEQYIESWLDLATMDGIMAGVWHRANVKSLVWYPVAEWNAAGYEFPETWEEMIALSDQMVADGRTPWCIGMESSGATGWVATDWMEDAMLRLHEPSVYDQWVTNELPFDSPEVVEAAELVGEIFFNEDYVLGGTDAILTVPFGDAPAPLFEEPPGCMMHRQASFIPGFFPEGSTIGEDGDVDFFYLPPLADRPELGSPVLGAGDIYGMFNDRPEVRQFVEYLTTGRSTRAWVEAGGFVSPHNDSSLDWYPTSADRGYAEILQNATTFRFDASDLMPGAVGTGTFWTAMVDWVSGEDIESVLSDVQANWPEE
ncbi:MAG: carbohydrate ABC transporter substrate-binding protein [Chloroflexi bacterium]|nr:carbohydrate ABC transporter substrate-binding protein [Chloroflexota bacterium]